MIKMNGINSWWCSHVTDRDHQNNKLFKVKPVAKKIKPRWVRQGHLRPCAHSPQVSTPHDSVVARVVPNMEEQSSG